MARSNKKKVNLKTEKHPFPGFPKFSPKELEEMVAKGKNIVSQIASKIAAKNNPSERLELPRATYVKPPVAHLHEAFNTLAFAVVVSEISFAAQSMVRSLSGSRTSQDTSKQLHSLLQEAGGRALRETGLTDDKTDVKKPGVPRAGRSSNLVIEPTTARHFPFAKKNKTKGRKKGKRKYTKTSEKWNKTKPDTTV